MKRSSYAEYGRLIWRKRVTHILSLFCLCLLVSFKPWVCRFIGSYPVANIRLTLKMAVQTGLDYMRSRTMIDCDTMDEEGE